VRLTSAPGTILPCGPPLVLVRNLGSSCRTPNQGLDRRLLGADRPSAMRGSRDADDPKPRYGRRSTRGYPPSRCATGAMPQSSSRGVRTWRRPESALDILRKTLEMTTYGPLCERRALARHRPTTRDCFIQMEVYCAKLSRAKLTAMPEACRGSSMAGNWRIEIVVSPGKCINSA
jgi:hypothetical protein